MDEEQALPEPKIGNTEMIAIGLYILVLDIIDLIPIAGDITDFFVLPVNYYLYKKGVSGLYFLGSEILDLIPGPQELPWRSIAWWALIYADRHPSALTQVAEKVGETLEAGEGEAAGASEAARAGAIAAEEEAEAVAEAERAARVKEPEAESRPSERKSSQGGGGEGQEGPDEEGEDQETLEKRSREEEIEHEMEMGAEVSPEEEAAAADFPGNDSLVAFDKAMTRLREKRPDEENDDNSGKARKAA